MDLGQVGFVGVVVVAVVAAIKDWFPQVTGNQTRLIAIGIGLVLGLLGQNSLIPGVEVNIVTGIMAAVAALGTVTVVDRIGH